MDLTFYDLAKEQDFVDDDCNIVFDDGTMKTCQYRPHMTFEDCEPGYGGHGECAKWNYYHKEELRSSKDGEQG